MEFIICDAQRMEVMALPASAELDFDIGDTNDVQITCGKGLLDFGMYVICPGTEYGALLEEVNSTTSDSTEKWLGNAFRRFLQELIIEPPAGKDYRVVSGDAHEVLHTLLGGTFGGMFTIPAEKSGIYINSYQFDRYTDALTGIQKMLNQASARINIEIQQGGTDEPFSVQLSAVPVKNLSEEIEYSEDARVSITLKESRRGINHLICLGKGELKDRQVLHLYVQLDGSISEKKYYSGLAERTAVYDYSSAEDLETLKASGTDQLKTLMSYKSMAMSVRDVDMQIGDIIAGRSYETGLKLQKPIVQKIVKISGGSAEIQYKVEGEE